MPKNLTEEDLFQQKLREKREKQALTKRRETATWYVLYVKHNHERRLVERFNQMELAERTDEEKDFHIEAYVPVRQVKRKWSDRIKVIDEVLTPGIIFVRLALKYQRKIYINSVAIRGLMYDKRKHEPVPIPDSQMSCFRKVVDGEEHVSMHEPQIGMKVRIEFGKFRGFVGKLIRVDESHKFQVQLNEQLAFSFQVKRENVVLVEQDAKRVIPYDED